MKNVTILILLTLLFLLTGCSSVPLFRADFNVDPVGGLPNTDPPEDPMGDSIFIASLYGPWPPSVSVIEDGAISGRSLRYSNIEIPSVSREVRFVSTEIETPQRFYWAIWAGRLDDVSDETPPLEIYFGNSVTGKAIFRIHDSALWIENSATGEWERLQSVSPERQHFVIVRIDAETETFTMDWLSNQSIRVDPLPLTTPPFNVEGRQLEINLRFAEEDHSDASYVIDNIRILEQEPEMP